ncbi:hypothetical protein D5086_004361 [Populus alba]|uniref:Uncharacterized protein n=1 Tax=Populus alba TaxID=43335 RepID=A0ACC4CQJ4_POPAL
MDHSFFNNPNQEFSTSPPFGLLDPSWDKLPFNLHDFSPFNSNDSERSQESTLPSDVPLTEAQASSHSIASDVPPNTAKNNSPQLSSSKEIKEQEATPKAKKDIPTRKKTYRGGSKAVLNFPIEQVRRSLEELKCGFTDWPCSPAEALKKTHSKRKPMSGKRKGKGLATKEVLVLEDLGADYLETLLSSCERGIPK